MCDILLTTATALVSVPHRIPVLLTVTHCSFLHIWPGDRALHPPLALSCVCAVVVNPLGYETFDNSVAPDPSQVGPCPAPILVFKPASIATKDSPEYSLRRKRRGTIPCDTPHETQNVRLWHHGNDADLLPFGERVHHPSVWCLSMDSAFSPRLYLCCS